MMLSIPQQKKIFARGTSQKRAMSSAKIAPAAARSDAVRGGSLWPLSCWIDPGAEHAAAASTAAAAQRLLAHGAVRGRSAFASLAARHPGPLERVISVFAPCTPARLAAEMMDRPCSPRLWVRGPVLARTVAEPCQNREVIEITGQFCPVLGFSGVASRDVRARVYASARAYKGGENLRTTEPVHIIHIIQAVSGSVAVLSRFSPEPDAANAAETAEFRGFRVKYWAETGLSASIACPPCASGGEKRGAGAKVSAVEIGRSAGGAARIAQAEGLALGDLDQAQRVDGNGGKAWVSQVRPAPVGTAMLERGAQWRGNAWVRERRRKLDRLTAGGARAIDRRAAGAALPAQTGGVAPPSAARQILCPLAQAIFPVSAQSHFHDCRCFGAETRQSFRGQIGSGWKSATCEPRPQTGRGVSAKCGLRRSGYRNAGGVHVN